MHKKKKDNPINIPKDPPRRESLDTAFPLNMFEKKIYTIIFHPKRGAWFVDIKTTYIKVLLSNHER